MITSKKMIPVFLIVLALAAMIIITNFIIPASAKTDQTKFPQAVAFEINNNGLAYGNVIQARELGYDPDLLEAIGTDGTEGYVYTSDLKDKFEPKTPEEAIAWQEANKGKDRVIPLYKVDGSTIIGEFIIYGYHPEEEDVIYYYE